MTQLNIAEAKAHFSEIIRKALLGEEIIIARDNQPLVKLVPLTQVDGKRVPGSGKGQLIKMAADFDSSVDDFEDYL